MRARNYSRVWLKLWPRLRTDTGPQAQVWMIRWLCNSTSKCSSNWTSKAKWQPRQLRARPNLNRCPLKCSKISSKFSETKWWRLPTDSNLIRCPSSRRPTPSNSAQSLSSLRPPSAKKWAATKTQCSTANKDHHPNHNHPSLPSSTRSHPKAISSNSSSQVCRYPSSRHPTSWCNHSSNSSTTRSRSHSRCRPAAIRVAGSPLHNNNTSSSSASSNSESEWKSCSDKKKFTQLCL